MLASVFNYVSLFFNQFICYEKQNMIFFQKFKIIFLYIAEYHSAAFPQKAQCIAKCKSDNMSSNLVK